MKAFYELNGHGDLAMDGEICPYIGQLVEWVKLCKSGLIQIRTNDRKLFSVPQRNLTDIQVSPHRVG